MKTDRTFLAEFSVVMTIEKMTFLVKVILIPGKFYIHKSKYMKVKPQFYIFQEKKTLDYPVFCIYLVIFNVTAFLCLFILCLSFDMHLFLFAKCKD